MIIGNNIVDGGDPVAPLEGYSKTTLGSKINQTTLLEHREELPLELLQLGDSGPAVAQLQAKLTFFDYYQGEINGQFEQLTQAALRRFQQENELIEDGYFGPETWYCITFWKREEKFPSLQGIISKVTAKMQHLLSRANAV
ncbi:MAG: peptidoglycan-binding domain-containing protein [Cyanobacteria bacterium P01_F01_bin.13]